MMGRRSVLACLVALCGILGILFAKSDDIYTELVFSEESGFYEEPFDLEIYAPPGTRIFYTLDGSDPDENAILYTGPIRIEDATQNENVYSMRTDMANGSYVIPNYPIDKCNVVNAAYRDVDGNFSKIESKTYFVGYESKIGYDELNKISIVTDPDNLFDYDTGIYILGRAYDEYPDKDYAMGWYLSPNYFQRGYEWERSANILLFDRNHTLILDQQCGIRIHGNTARSFLPKSINIYARTQYGGLGRFDTDLFNTQYMADAITLFTGSNDEISKLRDMLTSRLTADRNFATMNYVPYAMFLNGEYWGVYWMTEKYDRVYLGYYYDTNPDNIVIIKNFALDEGEDTDYELYTEMIDYMSNTDLSIDSNYQYACKLIDIQSYIDYYATEIYIANTDWPMANEGLWRTRSITDGAYEDGKWRWMLYDVNLALTSDFTSSDTFSHAMNKSPMFTNLCQNEDFKEQFTLTFMDLVNTSFTNENVNSVISEYIDLMEEPMNVHLKRFYGIEDAPKFVDAVEDTQIFLNNRKPYILQFLKDHFGLVGTPASVELEINDIASGSIILNSIEPSFDNEGRWSGEYYTDYPVTLTAVANDGCRFVRWECKALSADESMKETVSLFVPDKGVTIKAIFEKD